MNEIEGKIPGITGLVTSALLTTFENKISDVSNLVEKKKQIITQKWLISKISIFLRLITINSLKTLVKG